MYVIENPVKTPHNLLPNIPYLSGFKAAVVDIETTGLSPERSFVFLIGVLSQDEKGLKITQFFASCPEEEPQILNAFFEFAKDFDILLNYNGTSFDIPYINTRSRKFKLNQHIETCKSIDYMRLFKNSYLPQLLPDMKLKTVEKFAGVERQDTISGKECISLYSEFAEKGDKSAGRKILLHNFEDLSCFPCLNKLIGKIDCHAAFHSHGFPVRSGETVVYVTSVKQLSSTIRAAGEIPDCKMDCAFYEDSFTLLVNSLKNTFSLDITKAAYNPQDYCDYRSTNRLIAGILSAVKL